MVPNFIILEYEYIFKVRVVDFRYHMLLENECLPAIIVVEQFKTRVANNLGGMLCTNHYHLPAISCYMEDSHWIREVHCCCKTQRLEAEVRIKKTLS
jgi:hypothetical protein